MVFFNKVKRRCRARVRATSKAAPSSHQTFRLPTSDSFPLFPFLQCLGPPSKGFDCIMHSVDSSIYRLRRTRLWSGNALTQIAAIMFSSSCTCLGPQHRSNADYLPLRLSSLAPVRLFSSALSPHLVFSLLPSRIPTLRLPTGFNVSDV